MKTVTISGLLLSCLTITLTGYANDKANSSSRLVDSKSSNQASHDKLVTVYKNPTCGCCAKWIEHLEGASFHPTVKHPNNLNTIKNLFNIEPEYQSCHTAIYGVLNKEYIFEGHIPVKFIQQFLDNPPPGATGLAVPAMPLGSPGMEVSQRFTPYAYQLNTDGESTVFTTITRIKDQY